MKSSNFRYLLKKESKGFPDRLDLSMKWKNQRQVSGLSNPRSGNDSVSEGGIREEQLGGNFRSLVFHFKFEMLV